MFLCGQYGLLSSRVCPVIISFQKEREKFHKARLEKILVALETIIKLGFIIKSRHILLFPFLNNKNTEQQIIPNVVRLEGA